MSKTKKNGLFFLILALLCIATYLLNCSRTIYQCAFCFTTIAFMTNVSTFVYGKLETLKGLAFALITSFCLLWGASYHVDGRIINGLIFVSFASLMISIYWSTSVFYDIRYKFGFAKSNFASLLIAAVVDGFIMKMFFIINSNLSYKRIMDIFMRELSYKIVYGLVASAIVHIILNILKNSSNTKTGAIPKSWIGN